MKNDQAITHAVEGLLSAAHDGLTVKQRAAIVEAVLSRISPVLRNEPGAIAVCSGSFIEMDVAAVAKASPELFAPVPSVESVLAAEVAAREKAGIAFDPGEKLTRFRALQALDADGLIAAGHAAGHVAQDDSAPPAKSTPTLAERQAAAVAEAGVTGIQAREIMSHVADRDRVEGAPARLAQSLESLAKTRPLTASERLTVHRVGAKSV
jgi:hypothetical protein